VRLTAPALVLFAACALSCDDVIDTKFNPDLCVKLPPVLAATGLDFGEVERTGATLSFTLVAPSRAMEVGFTPVAEPFSLVPQNAVVTSQGTPFLARFTPTDSRLQVATTTFVGGFGCAPQTLTLQGLGAGQLSTPEVLNLPEVPPYEPSEHSLVLTNSRRVPLIVEASGLFAPLSIDTAPVQVPANGIATLKVKVVPFSEGVFSGNLVIRAHDATGLTRDVLTVLVTARIARPLLRVTPAVVDLAHVPANPPVGGALQRRLVLEGLDGGPPPIPITTFKLQPSDGELSARSSVTATGVHDVWLTFTPTARLGPRQWTLEFPGGLGVSTVTVPISARVETIAPCNQAVTVSPSSVASTHVAFPTHLDFTLTNPNATPCLVDQLRLEPARWFHDGGDQLVLDGGASETVRIDVDGPGSTELRFETYGAGGSEMAVPITLGL